MKRKRPTPPVPAPGDRVRVVRLYDNDFDDDPLEGGEGEVMEAPESDDGEYPTVLLDSGEIVIPHAVVVLGEPGLRYELECTRADLLEARSEIQRLKNRERERWEREFLR